MEPDRTEALRPCINQVLNMRKQSYPIWFKGKHYYGPDYDGDGALKSALSTALWNFVSWEFENDNGIEAGREVTSSASDWGGGWEDDSVEGRDSDSDSGEDSGHSWHYEDSGENAYYGKAHRDSLKDVVLKIARSKFFRGHNKAGLPRKVNLTSVGGIVTNKWVEKMKSLVRSLDVAEDMVFTWKHFNVDMSFLSPDELKWEWPMTKEWKKKPDFDLIAGEFPKTLGELLEVRRLRNYGWVEFRDLKGFTLENVEWFDIYRKYCEDGVLW
ncbi:hypothetical protein BJ508DRAFT_329789 [Ascobolus immersus RN42]|uniref:Uncharacterized protein n=1 Tax=Ascobolus immersus RN42 TaxID=1160509 RepID=A0A3N4I7Y9_ASCIM|nr:hypothetical protein BJ508DRAFT_329789 [Ascobolus immersus RN42]